MRSPRVLFLAFCALACDPGPRSGPDDEQPPSDAPSLADPGGGDTGVDDPVFTRNQVLVEPEQNLISLRIEPADARLDVTLGSVAELEYRVIGRLSIYPDVDVDVTDRSILHVADNYLVASFPADGSNLLSTFLPEASDSVAQRGGPVTVVARAANSDGSVSEATTSLSVRLTGSVVPDAGSPRATPALPPTPGDAFAGDPDPEHAPLLAYPNDGVLLPPNLGRLEVHFQAGHPDDTLFEVSFESATGVFRHFTRCYADPVQFVPGACELEVLGKDLEALAASNQGQGELALRVRGSDENGHWGSSSSVSLEFAEQRIDGAVYYWTASDPASIVRFDFGSGQSAPETFLAPGDVPGNDGGCVGCHAISRQGDRMFLSLGNALDGRLVYADDLSRPLSDDAFFRYNGAIEDGGKPLDEQENRVLTGAFDPTGSQFVVTAPPNDPADNATLFIHDGATGRREVAISLPFVPSHPDWSPDGNAIAFTSISGDSGVGISLTGGGIGMIQRDGSGWNGDAPIEIVPPAFGKNRFNPAFLPDGSLLLFSQVDQADYGGGEADACEAARAIFGRFCDGYSDPGSKTWAVAPRAGATPVLLANAAAPGVADAAYPPPQTDDDLAGLMDTYPRATPFQNEHRGSRLTWFTVGSQRRAGLRRFFPNPSVTGEPETQSLIWMFALDAERTLAGQDGSRAGFFLPFQDLQTSNHMAQWTERVVSEMPPPPPPATPPPPGPPPDPPPPDLR